MKRVDCNRSPLSGRSGVACSNSSRFAANPFQFPVVVVAHKLAERRLINLMKHVAELVVVVASEGEIFTVVLPKSADQGIAVLAA
jgi:hypothetical protein